MSVNGFNELVCKTQIEANVATMLNKYSRSDLREIARRWNIKRGQNKVDTIKNLAESKHFPAMFGMVV